MQVEELLTAMSIPILRVPGVEADDVIACLATRAVAEGFGVAIVSPDKASSMQNLHPWPLFCCLDYPSALDSQVHSTPQYPLWRNGRCNAGEQQAITDAIQHKRGLPRQHFKAGKKPSCCPIPPLFSIRKAKQCKLAPIALQDFFQLLQRNLMILKAPKKNAQREELRGGYQVYTAGHFEREYELKPSQWADCLALTGDKVGKYCQIHILISSVTQGCTLNASQADNHRKWLPPQRNPHLICLPHMVP